MDPYEKYDMTFNGAAPTRTLSSSPGKYSGQDNGWVLSLIEPVMIDFDKTIMKYPNIRRYPGGASNDLIPNLQHPENPVPLLKESKEPHLGGGAD
jgi:arylsulfatase